MKRLLKQAVIFGGISGIGFLIDFLVYFFLVKLLGLSVSIANMLSAIPAITFVFFTSTKKIFMTKSSNIPLTGKYVIYFIYQIILVTSVSVFGQVIYNKNYEALILYPFIISNLKIIIKCFITPFTMCCNFFVMKYMSEKL